MSEDREKGLVILALERGLVTAEQVQACRQRREQSAGEKRPSILRLLVMQGHLTAEQVFQLATQRQLEQHLMSIENCELVKELGTSTLGSSCIVQDSKTGQRYVLKILDRSLADDAEYRERVEHDATLAIRLHHPNIVRILGLGEKFGSVFVASECIEGASLRDLLAARGRLEAAEALSLAISAATALEKARELGLVHGAVSPSNLLVARDGTVKLCDLGVAKPRRVEVSISKTGLGVRSPNYLPPEHFDPGADLDIRSDLFSLGAVLYHCLCGQVPFHGDTTAEAIFANRNGVFRPLKEAAPDVPLAFAAVVEKLLQPEPERRYASPAALLAALQDVQAGRVPQAQRMAIARAQAAKEEPPKPEPAPVAEPEPTRRPLWPWLAAVGGVALLAAAAGTWHYIRSRPTRTAAAKQPEEEPDVADPAKVAREGREAIEQVLKAPEPDEAKDPAAKLGAVQEKIEKLKDIEKKYEGTEAAEEARKRLAPLQAEAMFQTTLAYAREHPGEQEAVAKQLRAIVGKYGDTAAAFKAEQELEKIEGAERKRVQRELEKVRQRAAALGTKTRFGEALIQYDELLKGNPSEEVKQVILQDKIAITSEAERAYLDIHKRAQEKIAGSYYAEAKALYDQVVASFGVEPYVGRARGEIAIITPLLKGAAVRRLEAIDAAKYQFFLIRLEPSIGLARSWEVAGAVREAEKIRPDLRTAGIENYLEAYLADVALLASLKHRVIRRLNDQAAPVVVSHFSLGKVGGKFDRQWLDAQVTGANDNEVVIRYGQLDVRRAWGQFPPDELYKLGKLAADPKDPQSHLVLGIHCLYGNLLTTAAHELHAAKTGAPVAASYLERVELLLGAAKPGPAQTKQEQASRLFMEAKRMMNERVWDRALYRLALLRSRHASRDYDVSANLDEINQRIAQCKKQVEKLEIETDLALGKRVELLRESLFDEWQQRFGKWTMEKGTLQARNGEDYDAECLFSLRHPPAYELAAKIRVLAGTGPIVRLAGKARPNIGFWLHTGNPALVGLLHAQESDKQADQRAIGRFTFQPNQWYEIRAVVNPMDVEVSIGDGYAVRMPNKLPPERSGLQTYGFQINPKSAAEFRDFSVRVLSEQ